MRTITPDPTSRWSAMAPKVPLANTSHRTYLDPGHPNNEGLQVACAIVDNDTLIGLAEAADRIEIREAGVAPHMLSAEARLLRDALEALRWLRLNVSPGDVRRHLRLRIVDQRARLRTKRNRHLLAGTAAIAGTNGAGQLLLLVLTRPHIATCDWQITA
jgi:hypothetical protein